MAGDARLAALVAPVAAGLERMRDVLVHALASEAPAVSDMIDHIGRFRGKQLRGALVLLAGRAAQNRDEELPSVAAIVRVEPDGPITTTKTIATFQVTHPPELSPGNRPTVYGNPNVAFDLMPVVGSAPTGPAIWGRASRSKPRPARPPPASTR